MKYAVWGNGRLGKAVAKLLAEENCEFIVKTRHSALPEKCDVAIDFSVHDATAELIGFALDTSTPLIIGTTGQTKAERELIASAAEQIPIVFDSNFSYGVFALKKILTLAKKLLPDWDCNIIEYHRNGKKDKPSGTALAMDAILRANAVHSVRIGAESGTHETIFWGKNEKLTLTHTALGVEAFADGALIAAKRVVTLPNGLYTMKDIFT